MRRRPIAVYRVIDEAELLGDPQGAPDGGRPAQAASHALADDSDTALASPGGFPGRHVITLGLLAFGLLALIAATLINSAPARHRGSQMRVEPPRQAYAQARPSQPVRLAVRVQTRITDSVRPSLGTSARERGPRPAGPSRHARAKRPPRVRQRRVAPAAPPAAAPVTAHSSPANEFGFER
jgi:hypothetical protein